jgi:hypothetical protein
MPEMRILGDDVGLIAIFIVRFGRQKILWTHYWTNSRRCSLYPARICVNAPEVIYQTAESFAKY